MSFRSCVCVFVFFFLQLYLLSIRLSIVSYRIFSSLFTSCSDPFLVRVLLRSLVSIYPSLLSSRTGSFPLSLRLVLFLPYLSICLFIVLYWIFSSLFTSCSLFDRIHRSVSLSCHTVSCFLSLRVVPTLLLFFFFVLLLVPSTPISSLDRGMIFIGFERTSLAGRTKVMLIIHVSALIYLSIPWLIN